MTNFTAIIDENITSDSFVIDLNATDRDSGLFGELIYSISNIQGPSEPDGTFNINEATGTIRTVGIFDIEQFAGPYILTVSYTDSCMETQQLCIYISTGKCK